MSKSKKNTIDPEEIIENYGADAVRLFMLSDSPPEKDVQWTEQGIVACYKFIQKLWTLHEKIKDKLNTTERSQQNSDEISKFTNQLIDKININLEKFHNNVIVANFYETYNFLIKEIEKPINKKNLIENYTKILKLMSPILPHFTSECLEELKCDNKLDWPVTDKKVSTVENYKIIVQINGKKRNIINTNLNMDEKTLINKIKNNSITNKFLKDKNISRVIHIKNKLINLIIK